MSYPAYLYAIEDALSSGYFVDSKRGKVIGLKGKPLTVKLRGSQRYPTVPLVTPNMPKRFYSVPVHKVVAFSLWGRAAFESGVHVRHLNGDTTDNRRTNLALGSPSDNENDKPKAVRVRSAKLARAAQAEPVNKKLTPRQVSEMRRSVAYGPTGRVRRGQLTMFAARFGVSKSAVSQAIRGITHGK